MYDINKFTGTCKKPEWNPTAHIDNDWRRRELIVHHLPMHHYKAYELRNAVNSDACRDLMAQFDSQVMYPVGVDGYSNDADIGSYRAMGWSPEIAKKISDIVLDCLPFIFIESDFTLPFDFASEFYELLGSTPWLRFMKYSSGGKHNPHYDQSFHQPEEKYSTIFSWVLFLNTPDGTGGSFQFVDDPQQRMKHPKDWDTSDHTKMSDDVLQSIKPTEGTLLLFPHWLCHQVEEFIGNGQRYIIRGDIAYGY